MFRRRLAGDRRGSNAWLETREGTGFMDRKIFKPDPDPPGKEKIALTGNRIGTGKVGAGGNTAPITSWGRSTLSGRIRLRQFPGATAITDAAFYRARAEEAKLEGSRTSLERVRAKCLRAAEAWTAMAERVEEADRLRKEARHRVSQEV